MPIAEYRLAALAWNSTTKVKQLDIQWLQMFS
jgi:hypothetical protein